MTEKEKGAAGLVYNPNYDRELEKERIKCKDMCYKYNNTPPSDVSGRKDILKNLIGKTNGNFWIEPSFWCDYGYNIELGNNFYSNHNLVILDAARVVFGDNVFIAPNCGFYTAGHLLDREGRNEGLEYAYPITIGSDVWIGGNVAILPGVTIGRGAVIGAGSVVSRDIPPDVVAFGNPCRAVRKITEEDKHKYKR